LIWKCLSSLHDKDEIVELKKNINPYFAIVRNCVLAKYKLFVVICILSTEIYDLHLCEFSRYIIASAKGFVHISKCNRSGLVTNVAKLLIQL